MARIRREVVRSRDFEVCRFFNNLNLQKYQKKPQNFNLRQKKSCARICQGLERKGLISLENGFIKLKSERPLQIYKI